MEDRTKLAAFAIGILLTSGATAAADYLQTNLVSDIPGLASVTDSNLRNPWGLSHSPTSPFWISDQATNVSTLYAVTGSTNVAINPLVVSIPTTATGPQGPTGQVNNTNTSSFLVNGVSARFIFANLNGTISAWNGVGTTAIPTTPPAAVPYTGLAINQAQNRLYAASPTGINVFDNTFAPVSLGGGAFATPSAIAALGLVPFNVQTINGQVYVTYAPSGLTNQRDAQSGQGAVAVFNENGGLLRSIVGSELAAPWGVAIAPATFGAFAGDLLVGNFSFAESEINAFDPASGLFLGTIPITVGLSNTPGGLWALGFGTGGNNGSPDTLYFTAGINGERDGLFGAIQNVPGPIVGAGLPGLIFAGAGLLGWWRRKRKQMTA